VTPLAAEVVDEFTPYGVRAFTTGRSAGSFSTAGSEPVGDVMARWDALRDALRSGGTRLATARQVHGTNVIVHGTGWDGWLRGDDADGHAATERGTAMAVSIADCVPVFIVHPSGATALLHSGWRGTAGRLVEHGIAALSLRVPAAELRVHLGPAICGRCYEVSPEVYERLTGSRPPAPHAVDLRAIIADHARAAGVRQISISGSCTRCDNARFYSHRAGDVGRQLSVLIADR
jgi:YfiH family protein